MGLAIRHEKGSFRPVLVCDLCGEVVESWREAVVTFKPGGVGQISDVRVYHKVKCDPGDDWWEGLQRYAAGLLKAKG